jgi:hypothetical protein
MFPLSKILYLNLGFSSEFLFLTCHKNLLYQRNSICLDILVNELITLIKFVRSFVASKGSLEETGGKR